MVILSRWERKPSSFGLLGSVKRYDMLNYWHGQSCDLFVIRLFDNLAYDNGPFPISFE